MKNLVFQFYLTVTLCWQSGIAEQSNGYFYDKPNGALFNGSPEIVQVVNSNPIFQLQQQVTARPTFGYFRPQPLGQEASATVEIVPSKLLYEDSQTFASNANVGGLQQPNFINRGNVPQPQQVYGGPASANLQPIIFTIQDGRQGQNSIQQPCGPEAIVAQFNPQLVDLSNGGPLVRQITTCGPGESNCNTITLQSDLKRHLGVLQQQRQSNYGVSVQPRYQLNQVDPRTANAAIYATETLVRPPNRRLIKYTEIEQDDPFN